jgi:ABC-2 type transport system permease protein
VLAAASSSMGDAIPAAALAGQGAALWLVTLECYGLTLLVSQLAGNRRSAAGAAGATLLVLFFLNSLSRTNDSFGTVKWLSPFAYYDANTPLLPEGAFNPLACLAMLLAALAYTAVAVWAFTRRDLGETLLRRRPKDTAPVRLPSTNPLLRTPALEAVYEQRWGLVFWLAGISVLAALFVSLAQQVVDLMLATPNLRVMLEVMMRSGARAHEAFLGFAWFGLLQLILALFVVTQVARWAAEDAEGRLEMMLAAPIPRWRVVAARALALLHTCAAIALFSTAVSGAAAAGMDVPVSAGGLMRAALMLVPLGLAFGAIGAALTGWAPRAAVIVLSAVAIGGYFVQQIGSLFRWPEWVLNLSPFQLYGAPLAQGINWPSFWGLLAIIAAGFALAVRTMQLREVGR